MKKIVFITSVDSRYGFSLAGVTQYAVKKEDAIDRVQAVLRETDTGLVVVDERLIKGAAEERLREMEKRWFGVLLLLPAPEKPEEAMEEYIYRLIKRAIGYHVRLKV